MIKALEVRNFTTLPDATWEFAPGLNVIVGENGLGKTHVLKLLYALLKVPSDAKDFSGAQLERAYADKLVGVFRPESLGRLVKRRQGRGRCGFSVRMTDSQLSVAGGFASNAKSQIELKKRPTKGLDRSPAYLPTRELVTLCPWFVPLYDNYHLDFEETWRDTVSLLGNPSLKGPREKRAAALLEPLEQAMGGKVQVDPANGRFYLQLPGEGRMEMPLVAEGLRKIAMLARLISTGTLLEQGYLFWDEPETNLNPKLIKILAQSIVDLVEHGIQVFVATHSLFLLREFEILLANAANARSVARYFGLHMGEAGVMLEQADHIDDIGDITALDESLKQSDRYLGMGN